MEGWKTFFIAGFLAAGVSVLASCDAPRAVAASSSSEEVVRDETVFAASFAVKADGEPRLRRIYFNPYTDSIKTVLNYYVNVEGEFSDGSYLPLDTTDIILRCDHGVMAGNEWIVPKRIDFEKVTFTAEARSNPRLRDTITIWIQRWKDPRDAADYREPEEKSGSH